MKKVVIIVLILLLAGMVAILVLRPGGNGSADEPPDFVKLLGELTPKRDVTAAEMAGQPCWDGQGRFTVSGACQSALPEKATRLNICLESGTLAALVVQGSKYGPQKFDSDKIGCGAGGESFNLYDDNSQLAAACLPPGVCILRLF